MENFSFVKETNKQLAAKDKRIAELETALINRTAEVGEQRKCISKLALYIGKQWKRRRELEADLHTTNWLLSSAQSSVNILEAENAALREDINGYIETIEKGQKECRKLREAARWRSQDQSPIKYHETYLIKANGLRFLADWHGDGWFCHHTHARLVSLKEYEWRPIDQPKVTGTCENCADGLPILWSNRSQCYYHQNDQIEEKCTAIDQPKEDTTEDFCDAKCATCTDRECEDKEEDK